jgi:hypothetical protein
MINIANHVSGNTIISDTPGLYQLHNALKLEGKGLIGYLKCGWVLKVFTHFLKMLVLLEIHHHVLHSWSFQLLNLRRNMVNILRYPGMNAVVTPKSY